MHQFRIPPEQNDLPGAAFPGQASLGWERWRDAAEKLPDGKTKEFTKEIALNPGGRRLMEALFGNSPFLTQAAIKDIPFIRELFIEGPDQAHTSVIKALGRSCKEGIDESGLATVLRTAKRRMALTVAIADIAGIWPLAKVTKALSDFAEAALRHAVAHLLLAMEERGAFSLPFAGDPEKGSGLIVLALGKLGAGELNYSSDIDLIVLFDPRRIQTERPENLQSVFVRLTKGLVRLFDERTPDGYVFRTDLRLRPDPASTPLAVSVQAAEVYYESLGQNWERAAMIKARPVAGDREAGQAFLKMLHPFIWRKNLDFAAIRDIHSIKRQINAHKGGGEIALEGHNIKLGRGGIREIEFFAQTQQLIWGGRDPDLRVSKTLDALNILAGKGHITEQAKDELSAAYVFLRTLEHRLQMIADEQTQTLPKDAETLTALAVFLGYDGGDAFSRDLLGHLRRVESHYANLFEHSPGLAMEGGKAGNLVFTGSESDPETLASLSRLGFKTPKTVDATLRGWHHGRYRATRNARSRELLTELGPVLLKAFCGAPDPDATLLKFDAFLSNLPAGVQLFSMLHSNPNLLELLVEILGLAPRLADHLSRYPSIFESVLTQDFFDPPPPRRTLDEELDRRLEEARDTEDVLDISRRWANDRRFQIGVQSLLGRLTPAQAAWGLSAIAEAALSRLFPRIEAEFAKKHGAIPGSAMAVIAMGKLGGREMTPTSDLDLIFVYSVPGDEALSDGPKPLPPGVYFARLSQRMINALGAQTAEGTLYEVDMRLRPSGNAGPIASSMDSFSRYHQEQAWTWEHMALTRARVITGPEDLKRAINGVIGDALTRRRDGQALLRDVAHMRARMDAEHHTDSLWDIKHLRGGLVDIEFIAQYLMLKNAHDHPEILSTNTWMALTRLGEHGLLSSSDADLLSSSDADLLREALTLWQALQGFLRLTVKSNPAGGKEIDIPLPLREVLARQGGVRSFGELKEKIAATAGRVFDLYRDLIEKPAEAP